jgi:hypothetical protein
MKNLVGHVGGFEGDARAPKEPSKMVETARLALTVAVAVGVGSVAMITSPGEAQAYECASGFCGAPDPYGGPGPGGGTVPTQPECTGSDCGAPPTVGGGCGCGCGCSVLVGW